MYIVPINENPVYASDPLSRIKDIFSFVTSITGWKTAVDLS